MGRACSCFPSVQKNIMRIHTIQGKKSVTTYVNGKRVASCMRDDIEIPLKPRVNVPRREREVPLRVMFDAIIQEKGVHDDE